MLYNLSLLLTLLILGTANAAVPNECLSNDVGVVSLPVISEDSSKGTFEYRYQIKESAESGPKVTILYLPGGPGGTSISFVPQMPGVDFLEIIHGLPKNYRVILTDPRGRGCNGDAQLPFPHEAFRTKYLADDILALVRALKLTDYILMGHSYGSLLATQVAVRSSGGEAQPPLAVVLTGVVGRALNSNEQEEAFNREWRAIWQSLPPSLRHRFPDDLNLFADAKGLPFAESGGKWFSYLESKLGEGVVLVGGVPLVADLRTKLMDLLSVDPAKQEELRKEVAESESQKTDLASSPMFLQIACREIFPPDTDVCRESGIPQSNPFDSAGWQVEVPLYYVRGANDPITPMQQAQYHFEHQTNPMRTMITVPRAGHAGVMALLECKDGFWASLLGRANLDTSLRACSAKPIVDRPSQAIEPEELGRRHERPLWNPTRAF